jgi:hypothetical protein
LTNAQVVMGGTANACNVYWKSSAATVLTDSTFLGTVLSGAGVTMTRTNWIGRAMATTDVTLTDPIPMTGCAAALAAAAAGAAVPTLSQWAMILLATLVAMAGLLAMRRQGRRRA